ncbi:MAG: hypothetical protein ABIU54_01935, partial [Candidatus Eisenbacteria bacterium]
MSRPASLLVLATLGTFLTAPGEAAIPRHLERLLAEPSAWGRNTLAALSPVQTGVTAARSAGDILAVYYDPSDALAFRVSLVAPVGITDGRAYFEMNDYRVAVLLEEGNGASQSLPAPLLGRAPFAYNRVLILDSRGASMTDAHASGRASPVASDHATSHLDRGWMAAAIEPGDQAPTRALVISYSPQGEELDRILVPLGAQLLPSGTTNVAFMHHGNQGLAYSDVFAGRPGAEASSGFDEILRVHEQKNIPGNFHLSALLQSSAEWNKQNGDPLDFNGWLRTGVTAGWAGMITSAYGQPIMPFMQGAMNDWAISRDHAMVQARYSYDPNVAWVPERVFLDPATYPNAGVIDWSGGHWQANGVGAVILDDSPHCQGHNKHQIHFLQGNGLRIIPRDGDFTGKLHTGDGQGALNILVNEANSGAGQYRITVYADDWEMAAEVAGWQNTFPNALETYLWMIDKCAVESAWLSTWKLDPALTNSNFNGDTFTPTYGTYGGIGDVNGYGGNNNAWYTDWAGYVPYVTGGNGNGTYSGSGGNGKNHGQLWNDAHASLQSAPNNKIRETGW